MKSFDHYFEKAIKSLQVQVVGFNELIIVHTKEENLVNILKSYDFGDLNVKLVEFDGESNYQKQVNLGIESASSEWISFFEVDDEYANIWFKNVLKYAEAYPDVDAFLPIVVDVDEIINGVVVTFTLSFTLKLYVVLIILLGSRITSLFKSDMITLLVEGVVSYNNNSPPTVKSPPILTLVLFITKGLYVLPSLIIKV